MRATDNKYVIRITSADDDSTLIRKNMSHLINFYFKEGSYDATVNGLNQKDKQLFYEAINGLFSLYHKKSSNGIIFKLFGSKIDKKDSEVNKGYVLNFEKFLEDYAEQKKANPDGIPHLLKAFNEATQVCYKKNIELFKSIKANPTSGYEKVLEVMNTTQENGKNIYTNIIDRYNKYTSLLTDYYRR